MKFVIQRVTHASVTVEDEVVGKIGKGYLVLIGIENTDNERIADKLISKLMGLRIFSDENDKINLSIKDVCGELLLVSQFTLYADTRKGNRPSFVNAGAPDMANRLYEYIASKCSQEIHTETGVFGAHMKVELLNDGPFTIILDSHEIMPNG